MHTQNLFSAIDECNLEKFESAIRDGGDVNAFDSDGNTSLMSIISEWAIGGDNEEVYKGMINSLLRNPNINVNVQNRAQKNTALHMAISFKNLDAVKLLLEHPDIGFFIRNNYQTQDRVYHCTALEYAERNEIGSAQIADEIQKCMNGRGVREQGRIRLSDDVYQLVQQRMQAQFDEVGPGYYNGLMEWVNSRMGEIILEI